MSKAGGMITGGVRNTVKKGKFVIICNVCKQTVKSITNNICEGCYDKWFEEQGNKG